MPSLGRSSVTVNVNRGEAAVAFGHRRVLRADGDEALPERGAAAGRLGLGVVVDDRNLRLALSGRNEHAAAEAGEVDEEVLVGLVLGVADDVDGHGLDRGAGTGLTLLLAGW